MKRHSLILAFATATAVVAAQNLSTEVKVDRTVVPAERTAERLGSVHPDIVSAPVSRRRLDLAEYGGTGTITRSSRLLAPAAWADTFAVSPYRGYVSGGYFPVYNAGVSAGYRLLQTAATRLGVWAQFDGYSYKEHMFGRDKSRYSNNTFTAGADLDRRFRDTGVLNVKLSTSYGRLETPTYLLCAGNHDISMTDLSAAWWAKAGRVGYHVGAVLHRFGFDEDYKKDAQWAGEAPPHILHTDGAEILFGGNAGVIGRIGGGAESSRAGLEVKADFLSRPDASMLVADKQGHLSVAEAPGGTLGVVSLTPYYAMGRGKGLDLRLGARIDLSTGGTGKKFHIAPDVTLTYSADAATVYVRATGGEVINTQRSLYAYSPFSPMGWQYERSHMPINVEGGFNLGPWSGFGVEVFGGWARANDWLMPAVVAVTPNRQLTVFRPFDIKGAHAGLRVSYTYRSIADVRASVEMAPQKENSGYYLWRDRAKLVVKADVAVRPVEALELTVGYELRQGRAYSHLGYDRALMPGLGDKNDLSFSARYSITPALDVFARGENLLDRKYMDIPEVPERGVHGLVGASFKF